MASLSTDWPWVVVLLRRVREPTSNRHAHQGPARTADPRYANVNKLLDLPHTPRQSLPTAAAYALAVAGALLFIASIGFSHFPAA